MSHMRVFLSPLAESKLMLILNYIEKEWGKNSRSKFLNKFKTSVSQISMYPYSCPESLAMKGIYKCLISKQSSFFYRVKNSEIEIITVFDNRQDQSRIFNEVKKRFG